MEIVGRQAAMVQHCDRNCESCDRTRVGVRFLRLRSAAIGELRGLVNGEAVRRMR